MNHQRTAGDLPLVVILCAFHPKVYFFKTIVFAHVLVTLITICLCLSPFISPLADFFYAQTTHRRLLQEVSGKCFPFSCISFEMCLLPGPGGDMTSGEA
jgi:hypothetical protein